MRELQGDGHTSSEINAYEYANFALDHFDELKSVRHNRVVLFVVGNCRRVERPNLEVSSL